MASEKVKHDDLFEDPFGPEIIKAENYSKALDGVIERLKKIAATSGKAIKANEGKSIDELVKLTNEYDKLNNIEKQLLITEQKKLNIMKQTELAQQKEAVELEKAKILKQEQIKKNRELAKEQLNLAKNTNTWTSALASFQQKFNTLGNIIGGFALQIGSVAANAVQSFFSNSLKSFRDAEVAAKKLEFAVKNIANGNDGAVDTLIKQSEQLQKTSIFSDDEIQKSQTALLQYGLTTAQVEKLIPKILDLASAQGIDLSTATDNVISGINGQVRALKDAGIRFEDTGSKTDNLAILMEKLDKFSGSAALSLNTSAGAAQNLDNRIGDLQEKLGGLIDQIKNELKAAAVDLFDFFSGNFDPRKSSTVLKIEESFAKQTKAFTDGIRKQVESGAIQLSTAYEEVFKQFNEAIRISNESNDIAVKKNFSLRATQLKQFMDELVKINKDGNNRIEDDSTNSTDNLINNAKTKKDKTLKLEEEEKDERLKIQDEYFKQTQKILKEIEDEEKKNAEEKLKLERQRRQELEMQLQQEKELRDERILAEEKFREEQEKEEFQSKVELIDKINNAYFDGIEKRLQKEQESLDKEISEIDNAIQIQQELANKGLENTLAFEEKRRAEALAKQAELEERRQKQEQAKQLASLFLELLKDFAKDGDSNAAGKAFAQTILAKTLSDVIAGSFADGVEDFKGKGTETSDSNLIRFSKGESVITAKGTRENPGLATAMNMGKDAVQDWMFKNVYLPNMPTLHDKNIEEQTNTALIHVLHNDIKSLEKTIRDKKELVFDIDKITGQLIKNEIEAGKRRIFYLEKRRF